MIGKGSWYLTSKENPKWNSSGRSYVGGFVMPEPCRNKVEKLTKKYGEPPADLTWEYFKD